MSEAEVPKPVEAAKPEAEAPATQPTEEKVEKSEEHTEKSEDKLEEKKDILKTTAKHDNENPRNNRKFDPSTREVTDDPNAIRKQVEFYFGDWNFPQDKFMWESCGGSENKPMKVKTIHSFKRMRTFQPYSAVIAALKDSKFLEVTGEEGEEEVKRKTPYQPLNASKSKVEAATVYVKGFGDETPNTQFDLESFFAQFGEVKGLKLRRTNENLFKGSVFVTFADEEEANKFIKMDPAPQWKDHDLKIMSKRAYCDEKNDLIRQGKIEPNQSNPRKFYEGKESGKNGRGRGRGGKDFRGRDQDDWRQRRENDQKNGFKDRRGGRGGRGGRGRGRGRGGRDGGRDQDQSKDEVKHSSNDAMPRIQSTADESADNKKRGREEDAPAGEPAAKKVDVKAE
ncbi:lupus La protein [Fusarium austroafricanum]|uniref:Lupus La protein n=1 Tax=Fusarium austroafricanum TaxID=2364996 RepID=A0A8H4KCQ2_9HYPO|nr:lupus La protein [Fusarium austroafricanum]